VNILDLKILNILLIVHEVELRDLAFILGYDFRDIHSRVERLLTWGFLRIKENTVTLTEAGSKALQKPFHRRGRRVWMVVESGLDLRERGFVRIHERFYIAPFNRLLLEEIYPLCSLILVGFTSLGEKWIEKTVSRRPFKRIKQAWKYYFKAVESLKKDRKELFKRYMQQALEYVRKASEEAGLEMKDTKATSIKQIHDLIVSMEHVLEEKIGYSITGSSSGGR